MVTSSKLHFVSMLGSLRKESYHAVIQKALPALAPDGITISPLGSIANFPFYNADIQAEGFPKVVEEMAAEIAASDGVMFVTPEYNYSIPGVLKNAIDWLSRLSPQPFAGKPVAIHTASPGAIGGARAQYQLRQSLVFLDAIVLNKPEVMIGQVTAKVTGNPLVLTDVATKDFISGQLKAFGALAHKLK